MSGRALMFLLVCCGVLFAAVVLADESNGTVTGREEDVETFEEVEKRFKKAMGSAVRSILPYLMQGGDGVEISGPCMSSLMRIIGGVRQLREWAVRFIDATGKIPPGILEGTSISVGDYDECLDIEVGRRDDPPKTTEEVVFRGKYCLLESHRPEGINRAIEDFQNGNLDSPIAKTKTLLNMFVRYKHLTNNTFKLGICMPSKCSKRDLENLLNTDTFQFAGKITVSYCKQKDNYVEKSADIILIICIFSVILAAMIIGTTLDVLLRLFKRDKISKTNPAIRNYLIQVARSTSLYNNALEVLNTENCTETIKCLCGLRPITVMLTIYSHTYGHLHLLHFQKFSKAANFLKFFESFTFSGIANGSVGMDTMAFIAGITITYNRWRFISEKGKVNLNVCKLLCGRYCRMTAAQLLAISVFLVLPLIGSGPFWKPYMGPMLNNCRERWWMNILYINNFWPSIDACLYQTWVLAVIMQLTLISAIIIWILKKSRKFGILTCAALVLSCIIGVAVITITQQLPGSMAFFMLDFRTAPITWRDIYILPYDHLGPFCIGLLAGYFLGEKKDELPISRATSVLLWISSTICNTAVLFGLYSYRHGEKMEPALSAFYAVMHRNVWALGIGWLVVACATRHGGAVTRVLHSKVFIPMDRLCYMAFLMHIPIMYFHSGVLRERMYMGHIEMLFLAVGYIALSFLVSFVLHIIFVQPYYVIERQVSSFFFSRDKGSFEFRNEVKGTLSANSTSAIPGEVVANKECINLAYSRTLDGL
ncbi:nose resistant to fluoxetine protein 6-like [Uloborus diversus]|uniref:nose resistant to fluoxetine protein 6-like n=1 Tax=Uloborus diversus TaxID=327109 RepID=UPI00240A16A0|nr:nose resistant to fluoxetine protein 6-like [Uloborus diversus]